MKLELDQDLLLVLMLDTTGRSSQAHLGHSTLSLILLTMCAAVSGASG